MQRNCQCLGRLQGLRAYERVWNMGGLHRYTVGWLPYFTATVQGLELEKTLHPKHLLALHTRPGRASTPTMPAMPPPQPPPPHHHHSRSRSHNYHHQQQQRSGYGVQGLKDFQGFSIDSKDFQTISNDMFRVFSRIF